VVSTVLLSDGAPLPETVFAGQAFTTMPITTSSVYVFGLDNQLAVLPIHCMPTCSTPTRIVPLAFPPLGDGSVYAALPLITVGSTVLFIYDGDEQAMLSGTTFAYRIT
jgi:hypothetical protein